MPSCRVMTSTAAPFHPTTEHNGKVFESVKRFNDLKPKFSADYTSRKIINIIFGNSKP